MPASAARKELVGNQIRYAEVVDASVLVRNPRARIDEVISPVDLELDGLAIAGAKMDLFSLPGKVYALEAVGVQFLLERGDTIVFSYPTLGISSLKGIIISLTEDTDSRSSKMEVFTNGTN